MVFRNTFVYLKGTFYSEGNDLLVIQTKLFSRIFVNCDCDTLKGLKPSHITKAALKAQIENEALF